MHAPEGARIMVDDVQYNPTIKELPTSERPRERLLHHGAGALSSAELLAIILRTGTRSENVVRLAQRLLANFDGLAGLARARPAEQADEKGLGPAKVTQVKAALELGRRMLIDSPQERPQVRSPADAANLVMSEMGLLEQENLRVMLLDTKNRVLDMPTIYVGSLNTSLIRVGELFREAIRANCNAIIVLHNHPSGDPTPSPEDVSVTRQIVEAGKLLDIEVLDHLVIGRQQFVSLKERGLGFS
jgi:DNA repair protein RadC